MGLVSNIDTSAFTEGDVLWLSPTVAGGYTTTKPIARNNSVYIAIVTRASNMGSIEVKIQNGYELDELHNVLITSAANGDILVYDSTTQLWKNTKTLNGTYNFTTLSATTANFGTISVDSPTLSVDAVNDRVGFGTATPAYKNDFAVEARIGAQLRDEVGSAGNNGDLLTSTGSRVRWQSKTDLSIPSTTLATTRRVPFFSDGPANVLSGNSLFYADATGNFFSVGADIPPSATFALAIAGTTLLFGSNPVLRFRNNTYLTNSYYSLASGGAGTGGTPGTFSLVRTIAGSNDTIFEFDPTLSLFRSYSQFIAPAICTSTTSVWTLGRHIASGTAATNGNYVEITINGSAYKLATVA